MRDDVEERLFHLALGLRPAPLAGPRAEAIVPGEGEEPEVVEGLLAVPRLHDDFHAVVETHRRGAPQIFEGAHVLAHGGGEVLGFHEAQVAAARVAEDVAEGIHAPAAFLRERDVERRVVHLALDAGAGLEADHRGLRRLRPQRAQARLDDGVAAGEAGGPQFLVQPDGGDVGIAREQRGDLRLVGVELPADAPGRGAAPSAAPGGPARARGSRPRRFSDSSAAHERWPGRRRPPGAGG